jgi:hypothetical protein
MSRVLVTAAEENPTDREPAALMMREMVSA